MKARAPRVKRRCGWAVLTCLTLACQVWKIEPEPVPVALAATPLPNEIRLTMADGRRVIVEVPRVTGDSVYGVRQGRSVSALAIDGITRVERRQVDGARTAGFVVLFGAGVAAIAVTAQGLSEIEDCGYSGCP